MKAIVFDPQNLAPDMVHDWKKPEAGRSEVVVRLRAAALNHRDLNITSPKNTVPFVYGSDGAGVIEQVGEGVTGWKQGDEVILNAMIACLECPQCLAGQHSLCSNEKILGGVAWGGTFAEYVKVPARNVVHKPAHLTMEQAAAIPMAMGTAWRALITQACLQPGETLLIQGIGGGVALACLQIAVKMGVQVIVTSGSNDKIQRALHLGAYAGINYREEDVGESVKRLTKGKGAHVVVASRGDSVPPGIQAAAKGGRIVQFAYVSHPLPSFDVDQLMFKQLSLIGSAMHTYPEFEDMIRFINHEQVVPIVSEVLPMDAFVTAFERMKAAAQFGKIVLSISNF